METVGQNESLSALAGLPVLLLFGLLATRFDLRRILFVGVAASILQFVPLLFAHNLSGLLVSSFVAGLLGYLVETALLDLRMRSCPEGLEGLSLSLIGLAMLLMAGASIWLGAQVFQRDGIVPLVFLAGFGSLVMLPFILRLPKSVASVQ
jgi:MFS family permease